MNPICTMCNQGMQFAGREGAIESYWCEDCDVEGHIKIDACEVCGSKEAGFHHTLKMVICEKCLLKENNLDVSFDERCDEDSAFEDRVSEAL